MHPISACAASVSAAVKDVAGVEPTFMSTAEKEAALLELTRARSELEALTLRVLAVADDVGNGLEARPMLGFSWGFVARGGEIAVVPPEVLGDDDWDEHLDTLRALHPGWRFSPGLDDLA